MLSIPFPFTIDHSSNRTINISFSLLCSNFGSLMRADQVRLSHRGRPLPAHPLHPTHSTTSMNTHLIKDSGSPQYPPMGGMAFEMEQYPPRKLPHPGGLPKLDADPGRFGPMAVQSPPFPQLSQPFSDLSSAASSVFTESNIQHDLDPRQISSSGTSAANPYEVPADSETGHNSISPPTHTHTLPSPRRSHTAAAMLASQPAFPPAPAHRPPPLTQSSLELFHVNHPAPPIPPHRANSTVGQLHSPTAMEEWKQDLAKLAAEPPDSDYSEVPNDSPDQNVVGTEAHSQTQPHSQYPVASGIPAMPSLERGCTLPLYAPESSIVSSDQYSSYSDIPNAAAKEKGMLEMESYHGPVRNNNLHGQFSRRSSISESISSFSSDDLDQQSKPAGYGGRGGVCQLESTHSGRFPQGQVEGIISASNSNSNNNNSSIGTFPRTIKGQPTTQVNNTSIFDCSLLVCLFVCLFCVVVLCLCYVGAHSSPPVVRNEFLVASEFLNILMLGV